MNVPSPTIDDALRAIGLLYLQLEATARVLAQETSEPEVVDRIRVPVEEGEKDSPEDEPENPAKEDE